MTTADATVQRIKPPARAESPRCATCGRSAHWRGSPGYHGHAYLDPKTAGAEANQKHVRDLLADLEPGYAALLDQACADLVNES